jgi:hypothetical protein
MSLFDTIAITCRPAVIPVGRKLYKFSKNQVPISRKEFNEAEIETVLATSFEDCFRQRPDLKLWYIVSVTN